MKKLTFTLLIVLSTLSLKAQLTNGNLETWGNQQWGPNSPVGSGFSYYEPGVTGVARTTHFLRTLNELYDLPTGLTGPLTCFRSDTAYEGSYSARLRSTDFGTFFIPGFLGTGDIDLFAQTIRLGRPYASRPAQFSAYYQYAPVGSDSAKFEAVLTKWDALNQVRDTIGYGKGVVTNAESTWKNITFNINYSTTQLPDTLIFIASSSGGYNLVALTSSDGGSGSTMWVDDMQLTGWVGIEDVVNNPHVSIYPNPSSDFIQVSYTDFSEALNITIYDMQGKIVKSTKVTSNNELINIQDLPAGTYGLVLQDSFETLYKNTIIKK